MVIFALSAGIGLEIKLEVIVKYLKIIATGLVAFIVRIWSAEMSS